MKIDQATLQKGAEDILKFFGETPENAQIIAQSLVLADMRGVSTHGTYLLEVLQMRKEGGQINIPSKPEIVSDSDATAIIDGKDGIGMVAGHMALDLAMKKAKQYGIGMVLVRNTNNVGALSTYTQKAADQGMIAIMCGNAAACMSPWGGAESFIGTSPISIAIPADDTGFNADMATSVVARGKIRKAEREGKAIPEGWALDADGMPTSDASKALKGTLYPIGGPKGSALAMAVDILSGVLSGSSYAQNIKSFHVLDGPTGVGVSIIAIDLTRFMPREQFDEKMKDYVKSAKNLKKAPGFDEILMPGEIERRKGEKSLKAGIEIDDKQIEKLQSLLKKAKSSVSFI